MTFDTCELIAGMECVLASKPWREAFKVLEKGKKGELREKLMLVRIVYTLQLEVRVCGVASGDTGLSAMKE